MIKSMIKENLYLITYKRQNPKKGKIAKIIGMKKITTKKEKEEELVTETSLCYQVVYEDGNEELIDMKDIETGEYHFVTIEDLLSVGMPKP